MPYRPMIIGAGEPGETAPHLPPRRPDLPRRRRDRRLLVRRPLPLGQRLVFEDMAYYTMVKTTTFNGINAALDRDLELGDRRVRVVRRFGYEDFRSRLS